MSNREERAVGLFKGEGIGNNYNCAQSVLGSFCEDYGLDLDLALKIATGFGGTATKYKGQCGAASGAVMVIGLKCGHFIKGDLETKKFCQAKSQEFIEKFNAQNASTVCHELLGLEKDIVITPEEMPNYKPLFDSVCPNLVRSAVRILESMDFERDV